MFQDVFETAHNLRQKETRQARFTFSAFQQPGQIFPNQRCHSDFTQAAPFKLLLHPCQQSKEEVVSKCVIKYCSSDFPKECIGVFKIYFKATLLWLGRLLDFEQRKEKYQFLNLDGLSLAILISILKKSKNK